MFYIYIRSISRLSSSACYRLPGSKRTALHSNRVYPMESLFPKYNSWKDHTMIWRMICICKGSLMRVCFMACRNTVFIYVAQFMKSKNRYNNVKAYSRMRVSIKVLGFLWKLIPFLNLFSVSARCIITKWKNTFQVHGWNKHSAELNICMCEIQTLRYTTKSDA